MQRASAGAMVHNPVGGTHRRQRPRVPHVPSNRSPLAKENTVLSPHELATLMLIGNGPHTRDDTSSIPAREIDPVDLDALIAKQLVILESRQGKRPCPQITADGRSMLAAVGRLN
jgi:hypothetical protein